MREDYSGLFVECVKEGTVGTLPPNCAKRGWPVSKMCRMSGGCSKCYAELLIKKTGLLPQP